MFLRDNNVREGYRSLTQSGHLCHSNKEGECIFKIKTGAKYDVVLVGDSHADSLSNNLFYKLKKLDVATFTHMTASSCPLIRNFAKTGSKYCTFETQEELSSDLVYDKMN